MRSPYRLICLLRYLLYLTCPFRLDQDEQQGALRTGRAWRELADPKTGEPQNYFLVLTCNPNGFMAELHNSMPLIIDLAEYNRWLSSAERPGLGRYSKPSEAQLIEAARAVPLPAVDDLTTTWRETFTRVMLG